MRASRCRYFQCFKSINEFFFAAWRSFASPNRWPNIGAEICKTWCWGLRKAATCWILLIYCWFMWRKENPAKEDTHIFDYLYIFLLGLSGACSNVITWTLVREAPFDQGHGIHGMILTLGHALRLWGPWYGTDQRMFSWCAPDFCLFLHKQIMCIKMLMYGQRLSGKDGEVWWSMVKYGEVWWSMVKYCRELRELPWWKGLPSPSPWPAWKYFFV